MIYTHARFENYIGFYNGMGLNVVDIDFTLCRHNVILISGMNGSGKSTLMSALSLFPDPTSFFIPGTDGRKQLTLTDNGDFYEIDIRNSKTNKAFIKKNGLELNPNGNITSYKDILYTEFDLDANFSSLSSLSSQDRGLADKIPSERKRFISSIIENLEVYNNMYKTLNKKALIFKSHVNTLHTKIQNIGDKEQLKSILFTLQTKDKNISDRILSLNNAIVEAQTRSKINTEELELINSLNNDITDIDAELANLNSAISVRCNRLHINKDDIEAIYNQDSETESNYSVQANANKAIWVESNNSFNSNKETILSLQAQLSSLTGDYDKELEKKYNDAYEVVHELETELETYKVEPDSELITPLTLLLNFLNELIKKIDSLYENLTIEDIDYIMNKYDPNHREALEYSIKEQEFILNEQKNKLINLDSKLKTLSILDNRPSNCKINTCPFIEEAIKIKAVYKDNPIEDQIEDLMKEIETTSYTLTRFQNELVSWHNRSSKYTVLRSIKDSILNNDALIQKFIPYNFENKLDNILLSLSSYNFIYEEIDRLGKILNILQELKSSSAIYDVLEMQYQSYKEKQTATTKLDGLIYDLQVKNEELLLKSQEAKSNYDKFSGLQKALADKLITEKEILDMTTKYNNLIIKRQPLLDKLTDINAKSSKATELVQEIYKMNNTIESLNQELIPIRTDISNITGKLSLLDSYYVEYNEYKAKYDMIEVLKKYCSPTSGGIQTIFMQIYMSKTLDLCNQILAYLFNGQYKLLDFVINANEFRIPFIGYGLPVDDISSGSNSQKCMFGMIINLVLKFQSAGKLKAFGLDEVDAPLDSKSRTEFMDTIFRIIPMLDLQQVFMISHSMEIDANNVDVIKLKSYEEFDITANAGNVIWDYKNIR